MINKYHIKLVRKSLVKKEVSTFQFNTPLSLREILNNMLTEDSLDDAERTLVSLEITNLLLTKTK